MEGQIIVQPCHDINPSEAGIKLPEAKDLVGVKHIKHGVKLAEKKEGMDGKEEEEEERSRRLSRNSEDEDTEGSTSTHERCFYASFKIYLNPDSR